MRSTCRTSPARESVPSHATAAAAIGHEVDAQHGARAQRALDLVDAPGAQQPAPIDDADRGAQLAQLREDVAADQDRLAHVAQRAQDLAHLHPRPRVEAGGGLVEDQQLRVVDQRVGQAQSLAHAARQ